MENNFDDHPCRRAAVVVSTVETQRETPSNMRDERTVTTSSGCSGSHHFGPTRTTKFRQSGTPSCIFPCSLYVPFPCTCWAPRQYHSISQHTASAPENRLGAKGILESIHSHSHLLPDSAPACSHVYSSDHRGMLQESCDLKQLLVT